MPLRSLIFSFLLSLCSGLSAQNMPFGIEPESFSRDANTPGVYEVIAARHIGCDTTLTNDELILLYYGAAFRSQKIPSERSSELDSIRMLNQSGQFSEAAQLGFRELLYAPANASLYWDTAIARHHAGDSIGARCLLLAYYKLISIPYYSGDGSREAPFWVINPEDELLILNELDFEFISNRTEPPLSIITARDVLNDISFELFFHIGLWYASSVSQETQPASTTALTKKEQRKQSRMNKKKVRKDKRKQKKSAKTD